MFGLEMIGAAAVVVEIGIAVALFWISRRLHAWARLQEKEPARIQKEWTAVADKYEELARHAEDLAGAATVLEDRERLQSMSRGYAVIYGGEKPDPDKVN